MEHNKAWCYMYQSFASHSCNLTPCTCQNNYPFEWKCSFFVHFLFLLPNFALFHGSVALLVQIHGS